MAGLIGGERYAVHEDILPEDQISPNFDILQLSAILAHLRLVGRVCRAVIKDS
jgi:hypothetical protein